MALLSEKGGREGSIESQQKFDFFSYDDTPKEYVQGMNITLLLGTFYALASLSAGCFSTKTNKYHLIPYYVNQIKIEQFLPL